MTRIGLILAGVILLGVGLFLSFLISDYAFKEQDTSVFYYLFFSGSLIGLAIYFLVKVRKHDQKRRENYISGEEQQNDMAYFEYTRYTPALWAAKFGHLIGCGDLRDYSYEDKEFEEWLHELFRILHTENLKQLRRVLLEQEEISKIEKEIENGF